MDQTATMLDIGGPHGPSDARLVLVTAARIITQSGPDAEAMVLFGDHVLATGSAEEMSRLAPGAPRHDYGDATVVPGFNDAHQHLTMMAAQTSGLDLSAPQLDSPDALAAAITRHAASLPAGGWMVATRYDHVRSSAGQRLTRAELDAAVPDRPAILVHIGAHWGVANSRALAAAGLDDGSVAPAGGELGRDAAGRLDGFVSEQPLFDFVYPSLAAGEPIVPPTPVDELVPAILASAEKMLAAGITSVCDAMVGPRELQLLQRARDHGLPLRVNALLTFPHLPALTELGLRDGFGDEWLRIGGIKAFVDGAVAGRSCAVAEPFEGTDDTGILTTTAEQLQDLVGRATAAGTRLAVHANGERAIEMVLDALEQVAATGAPMLRHRIEHCSIVTPSIVGRMKRLDVIAVPFGSYAYFHGDKLLQWYGVDRLERMFAHRSLRDAGITVAGSSDYPCGPWEPLLGLQSCVTRRSATGRDVGPSQRLSVREALELYTVGSAASSGEDGVKGRLAPGFLADFTVLDGDLMTVDPDRIGAVRVRETWVGGVRRWAA
ncbi:amidohydrolase [Nostocoides sp. Soil756]|jgi:predicted amidohydrolase YtcJ|uniref:amidohydrolase n=1 Tax=Nostocoides sp. Soil756 TaxID=1736399 RepID=UPI000B30E2D5|nr:amidohydrolase [Tetrasphaera sp. Soil756]